MYRERKSNFFLEDNSWVQLLHGIVAIPAIVHVQTHKSLRLEYSTLYVHVHVHCTLHTTYYTLTTNSLRWSHFSQQATYDQKLVNLRDRDNLRTKDNRPVPKVSFARRFDSS